MKRSLKNAIHLSYVSIIFFYILRIISGIKKGSLIALIVDQPGILLRGKGFVW